jgi:uncharacterized membrane protein
MRTTRIFALSLLVSCLVPSLAAAQTYTVTDLGPLAPTAINVWGQVVGDYNQNAYMWTLFGGRKDLGILSGGTFSHAAAINDLGVVTGIADGPFTIISPPQFVADGFPNVYCPDLTQPFLWTPAKGMQGLGTVVINAGGLADYSEWCDIFFYAEGINIHGQMTGYTSNIGTYQYGLLWTSAAGFTTFGGSWPPTFANGISSNGQIVGQDGDCTTTPPTCFVGQATSWKSGVATYLASLGSAADDYSSAANGVNDLGQIVGYSTTAPIAEETWGWTGDAPTHAIIWSPSGTMTDLGTLPGDSFASALKINLLGIVIGVSGNGVAAPTNNDPRYEITGRPFVWSQRTGMRDLNTLIPASSGWVLNSATDINFWGQIVGSGTLHGEPHGFLLTPR